MQASLILDEPTLWPSVRVWVRTDAATGRREANYYVWEVASEYGYHLDSQGTIVAQGRTRRSDLLRWMERGDYANAQVEITYHDFIDVGL